MNHNPLFAGLALACLLALPAAAQDKPKEMGQEMDKKEMAGQGDPMMDAMMKAATPGEHHKALGRYVGDWTFVNKMWMAPGEPPSEWTGTVHAEWMLGGRYVHSVYKGDFGGMPFEGQSTEGYDNLAKQFVSTWVDNMGTGIMYSTGTCDEAHKVCTSVGDFLDPVSGQKMTSRSVVTWNGDDSYVMEMFNKDAAGKETKVMEVTAKKK